MTLTEFSEMFFRMAEDFPYKSTAKAVKRAAFEKDYLERLFNKCKRFADRNCIDEHDALHHMFGHGKLDLR